MRLTMWPSVGGVLALLVLGNMAAPAAQVEPDVVQAALQTSGLAGIKTIRYQGTATRYDIAQSRRAGGPGLPSEVEGFVESIDFGIDAMVTEGTATTETSSYPQRVGGRHVTVGSLWSPAVRAWTTPWGFLKGAEKHGASTERRRIRGRAYHVVTWQLPFKSPAGLAYQVTGYLNDELLVERVECLIDRPVLGDVSIEAEFSDYVQAGGIRFPARIVERHGGRPVLEVRVHGFSTDSAEARRSISGLRSTLMLPRARSEPKARSEQLAPGVHLILVEADAAGVNSLAAEFADHILLFEPGPSSDAYARLAIAEARRLFPGKPIRYGVISHHHPGAIGGLPAVAAEGITIVTPHVNRAFLTEALNAPRTLAPDALARSARKPVIEGFRGDRRVFRDGTRTVEIHVLRDMPHAEGMVVAWLPDERILAYVEVFGLWPAPLPRPGPTPANYQAFLDNLERLRLDPAILVPANGRALHLSLDEIRRSLAGENVDFEQ